MDTLRLEKPREWKRVDVAAPEPQPGDAVVRVLKVGVCGTDVGGYLGKFPFFKYPRIPGHELAVEVLSLPEGVEHIEVGDLCAVEPYINCQTCQSCRQGTPNCCENHKTLGVMCDGGLTEQIAVPARRLHRANGLEPEQAALVETLAVGCHAVDRGMVAAGESALILGAGPIGLAAYEFVKLAGATPIV
ncbi:MAG: alcohol dehydrogenase catalytic domain-containing protein, partial [Planctomycetota bacterium]